MPGMRGARPGGRSAAAAPRWAGRTGNDTLAFATRARGGTRPAALACTTNTMLIELPWPHRRPRLRNGCTAAPRSRAMCSQAALTSTAPLLLPSACPRGSAARVAHPMLAPAQRAPCASRPGGAAPASRAAPLARTPPPQPQHAHAAAAWPAEAPGAHAAAASAPRRRHISMAADALRPSPPSQCVAAAAHTRALRAAP